MNRRNFFKAATAAVLGGVAAWQVDEPTERFIEFSPPGEKPAICWMAGHRRDLFMSFPAMPGFLGDATHVKYGYGSKKLSGIGMYLSDVPKEGFEPITYCLSSETERNI